MIASGVSFTMKKHAKIRYDIIFVYKNRVAFTLPYKTIYFFDFALVIVYN